MYPLPRWFYSAEICVISCVAACIVFNRKQIRASRFVLASAAAVGLFAAVTLAAYIMWTPPGNPRVLELQARYFVPVLPVVAFFAPPLNSFTRFSRNALTCLTLGFLLISAFTLLRIVDHYYFPRSALIGKNIYSLFTAESGTSCPAWVTSDWQDAWFGYLANGRAAVRGFRVVLATEEGIILGESDPALVGADFPYGLLPGASRGAWRLRAVNPKTDGSGRLWLITGNSACPIKTLKFVPVEMPDA